MALPLKFSSVHPSFMLCAHAHYEEDESKLQVFYMKLVKIFQICFLLANGINKGCFRCSLCFVHIYMSCLFFISINEPILECELQKERMLIFSTQRYPLLSAVNKYFLCYLFIYLLTFVKKGRKNNKLQNIDRKLQQI